MMARCHVCDGQMAPANSTLTRLRGGRRIQIVDVPVRRCSSCGEEWLSARVIKAMDQLIAANPGATVLDYSGPEDDSLSETHSV